MGFVFTIIYILLAYLSPASLFPNLAPYRIELWVGLLAVIASIPAIPGSRIWRYPQSFLIVGLLTSAVLSMIANHWLGGALLAFEAFLPQAVIFYLVAVNCRTMGRLKTLIGVLAIVAVISVAAGIHAVAAEQSNSAFLTHQANEMGEHLARIRGLGFNNDPNDLAQFLVTVIALLGIYGRRQRILRNLFVIGLPALFMFYGIYLTHSRGGIVALAVVLLFSFRHRLGATKSTVFAAIFFAVFLALGFSGGRSISANSGSDRLAAWGAGLGFFKSSPVLGIGFNRFADSYEITAHNSFVQCLAELGTVGYLFWLGMLVVTFSNFNSVLAIRAKTAPAKQGLDAPSRWNQTKVGQSADQGPSPLALEKLTMTRGVLAVRTALTGFLTAALFLSRAYVMTLFLLVGMATAICSLEDLPDFAIRKPIGHRLAFMTVAWMIGSVAILYVILRARIFL
jgi:O-antigen ligase